MATNFPLVNAKISIDEKWEQTHELAEIITVADYPYIIKLKEVPDDGSENTRPIIAGMLESLTYPPDNGKFYVNYNTGEMAFSAFQTGNTYNVDYWQKGSLVSANEINYIYNETEEQIKRSNLEVLFNKAYTTAYNELSYLDGDITNVDIWDTDSKTAKLFSKVIGYSSGNINLVTITDEINSTTLTKTITYDVDGNINTITTNIT